LQHTVLDLDAAAHSYERRLTLAPQSAPAHLDLGRVYQAQDRLDDALAEYLAAALLDPASASALAAAGQLRATWGTTRARSRCCGSPCGATPITGKRTTRSAGRCCGWDAWTNHERR
jgi:tetratricopeptide (TPR) repeat protein